MSMYLGYFRDPDCTPTLVGVPSVFYNVYSFILPTNQKSVFLADLCLGPRQKMGGGGGGGRGAPA